MDVASAFLFGVKKMFIASSFQKAVLIVVAVTAVAATAFAVESHLRKAELRQQYQAVSEQWERDADACQAKAAKQGLPPLSRADFTSALDFYKAVAKQAEAHQLPCAYNSLLNAHAY